MALELTVAIGWFGKPSFLLDLTGEVLFHNKVVGDIVRLGEIWWPLSDSTLLTREHGGCHAKLIIPLTREAIRFIEENRRDQDVPLMARLQCTTQEAIDVPGPDKRATQRFGGSIRSDTVNVQDCVITRSDWLKRLAEMGWQEYEVFEVAKQPLLADPNLAVAFTRLQEAQTALRSGDYSGVLVKCRAAFESAAKHQSNGDVRKGFEVLLDRGFKDEAKKQESLNAIIRALSDFFQLGRHEQYPVVVIARDEAEFVYTTSISLFSLLSRRISNT